MNEALSGVVSEQECRRRSTPCPQSPPYEWWRLYDEHS
jgi:hypothetical protein